MGPLCDIMANVALSPVPNTRALGVTSRYRSEPFSALIVTRSDSPSAFTRMVVVCLPSVNLLRSTFTMTALLLLMAVVPAVGVTLSQSTSMPVMSQFTSPALPVFFTSKVSELYSVPKFNTLVLNEILDVLFSTSAVIFKGNDSLSAFTMIVASLYSVMRSRFNVTVTALLFPAANVPVVGFTLNQSILSNPLMFQLNVLLPLF